MKKFEEIITDAYTVQHAIRTLEAINENIINRFDINSNFDNPEFSKMRNAVKQLNKAIMHANKAYIEIDKVNI